MRQMHASSIATLAGLSLAGLTLGHELTYLLAHGTDGFAAAMSERGHDRYWSSFLTVVLLVVSMLLGVAVLQLQRLRRLAALMRSNRRVEVSDIGAGRLWQLLGPLWFRVAVIVLVAFFLQENAELAAVGAPPPWLGVFTGEHWVALPTLILASGLVALVGALVKWRREILLRKLDSAASFLRAPNVRRPRLVAEQPRSVLSARRNGERAPPKAAIASS